MSRERYPTCTATSPIFPPGTPIGLEYTPTGGIPITAMEPPETWSPPYFRLRASDQSWPPAQLDASCSGTAAACSTLGWCSGIAQEIARVQCQMQATYPGAGICISVPAASGGAFPSPLVPLTFRYNAHPGGDPEGRGRLGGSYDFASSPTSGGYVAASVAPCLGIRTASGADPSPRPEVPVPGPTDLEWPLDEKLFFWCRPGLWAAGVNAAATAPNDVCQAQFKTGIFPSRLRQLL